MQGIAGKALVCVCEEASKRGCPGKESYDRTSEHFGISDQNGGAWLVGGGRLCC
jgi:hypothetical protein